MVQSWIKNWEVSDRELEGDIVEQIKDIRSIDS